LASADFKMTIERAQLLRALSHAQSIVQKRVTIPILSNVLIEADEGGGVRLLATDLDIQIREQLNATIVEQPGAVTVAAHMLHDIVRELPEGCQIELEASGSKLQIRAARARYTLPILPSTDFPILPEEGLTTSFAIPAATLKEMIDKTRFATSDGPARPQLCGIFLHAIEGSLVAASSDTHRVAKIVQPLPEGAAKMPGIIMPNRFTDELRRLIDEMNEPVLLTLDDRKLRADLGDVVLLGKLIEGQFPDYERVIPKNHERSIQVAPRAFEAACRRVSLVSSEKTRSVKLSLERDKMTVSVTSTENGAADEEVTAIYDGDPFEIGFNSKYLAENLKLIGGDTVELHPGNDPKDVVLITAPCEPKCTWVVMPMRV
jgi:DNA polymerase-3 subunit beta